MLVTFISQCEKKALNRTRRVLDAFAVRIGDCAWQTLITEDGLLMVKKLLRQNATKSTAVACHWRRGKRRDELLWIVGNRKRFNVEGAVPVNVTQKKFITDEKKMNSPNNFYANTQLQQLSEHLFAVGYVAEQLLRRLLPGKKALEQVAYISGCLHDIGKVDPKFQEWVVNPKKRNMVAEDGQHIDDKKFTFDKHPRHNEISLLIYHLLDRLENKKINARNKNVIRHVIYWHHAKPFRKNKEYANLNDIYIQLNHNLANKDWDDMIRSVRKQLKEISEIECAYRASKESFLNEVVPPLQEIDDDLLLTLVDKSLPNYKEYSNQVETLDAYAEKVQINAINNILRAVVITADRLVSKELNGDTLKQHIESKILDNIVERALQQMCSLEEHIQQCLNKFNKYPDKMRTEKQSEVAQQLHSIKNIGVLSGAAGCGKTKIALEWAKLAEAKKIIWICPRVQICQGIFNELTSEDYLPNARIEINTSEYKYISSWEKQTSENEYFSGDVVVTTIDQVLSNIITHTKVTGLIDFLNAHVVFDEFHEYLNMPAFNLLFAELVECKRQCEQQANTLLVSATPNYYFIENFLRINKNHIIKMPSFNQSQYKIELKVCDTSMQDGANLFYQPQFKRTFVISNTALTAQQSFIDNYAKENSVLLHSKYKKSDKKNLFNEVYDSFKKNGTEKYKVLRSGPIVQASLNISCDYMISEITNAENTLQRLGRLDRFGQNREINVLQIVVSLAIHHGRGDDDTKRFLSNMTMLSAAREWYQFLQAQLENEPMGLQKIYNLYEKFYQTEQAQRATKEDMLASFKQSVLLINQKILEPINIMPKKIEGKTKISKYSLRGDTRFVQMAVYDLSDPLKPIFKDQYAYEIKQDETIDNLTLSTRQIEGYKDSNRNLLSHMAKKHHRIFKEVKARPYNDLILLDQARYPEFPIYLSYIPSDLAKVEGESARHAEAIYYVVTAKQPVGAMSIKQFFNIEEVTKWKK